MRTSPTAPTTVKKCALEATCDEPIVGIDGTISALGEIGRVLRSLDAEPPLLERCLAIGLELFGGGQCSCDLCRLERYNECARHGRVDLHRADVEAITAAPFDKMLAGAVIAGR